MSKSRFEKLQETILGFAKSFRGSALDEAANKSLSRVRDHIQGRNVGLISANRQLAKPEVNNRNHAGLAADIKAHGFGFVKVKGVFPEKQNDGSTIPGEERSFLITAPPEDKEKLHKFLMKHGAKYDQDSVVFKPHDSEDAEIHTTTARPGGDPVGHVFKPGKFRANKLSDYMTKLKGDRTFTFESVIVEWHDGWIGEWKKAAQARQKG